MAEPIGCDPLPCHLQHLPLGLLELVDEVLEKLIVKSSAIYTITIGVLMIKLVSIG